MDDSSEKFGLEDSFFPCFSWAEDTFFGVFYVTNTMSNVSISGVFFSYPLYIKTYSKNKGSSALMVTPF